MARPLRSRGRPCGALRRLAVAAGTYVALLRLAAGADLNPLEKTIELLTGLQGKVMADGQHEEAAYQAYRGWCKETSEEKAREVASSTKQKDKLTADIQLAISDIEASSTKIDELSTQISTNEEKLKELTATRSQEAEVFKATEKQLMEAVDMLARAIELLEKEMKQNGGSSALVQTAVDTESLENVLLGLGAVIDAAGISADAKTLFSMLETRQDSMDGEAEAETGAPAAAAYESQSGSVVDVMEDMRDKAEAQLRDARTAEANAQHNFDMLKASLRAMIEDANKELNDEKAGKASAEEAKASAQGDLSVTERELTKAQETLQSTQSACLRTAADHEADIAGRKKEYETVSAVKKVIQNALRQTSLLNTAGPSFVQVAMARRKHTHGTSLTRRVVAMVKHFATNKNSTNFAQLASRLSAAVHYSTSSDEDPFAKVKGLIQDLLRKLTQEDNAEAEEKKYCDDQLSKTDAQRADLEDASESLKGKIDKSASSSAELKAQVTQLQSDLADLAKQEADMDKARVASNEAYLATKASLTAGMTGVRTAIRILRDYYAADEDGGEASLVQTGEATSDGDDQPAPPQKFQKSGNTGDTIIALLETVESDFAKTLAEEETLEAGEVSEYEKTKQENAVTKTMKMQDVAYKVRERKELDKAIVDLSSDHDTTSDELDAVMEYLGKLKDRCVAKAEPFEERQRKRQEEINGLKEALALLDGDGGSGASAGFLQRKRRSQ